MIMYNLVTYMADSLLIPYGIIIDIYMADISPGVSLKGVESDLWLSEFRE